MSSAKTKSGIQPGNKSGVNSGFNSGINLAFKMGPKSAKNRDSERSQGRADGPPKLEEDDKAYHASRHCCNVALRKKEKKMNIKTSGKQTNKNLCLSCACLSGSRFTVYTLNNRLGYSTVLAVLKGGLILIHAKYILSTLWAKIIRPLQECCALLRIIIVFIVGPLLTGDP